MEGGVSVSVIGNRPGDPVYQTSLLGAGYDTRSIFKQSLTVFNSEFSIS